MAEDHRHPGVRELVRDVASLVRPHRLEVEIGDLRPAQELEREYPRRRVLPDHAWHDDPFVLREVAVERLGVARLVPVVELEPDRARELVDELLRVHELQRLHALAEETRSLVEEAEVGLDLIAGGRALHLHGHLLPVGEDGAVHLADRRRCDRREVELEKRPIHPEVELGLDGVAHLLERDCRRVVLQPAKLGDDVRRDDVGTRREELAELHEGRPELVEHHPQALATIRRGDGIAVRVALAQPVSAEDVAEPVTSCDLRDLRETPEVARRPLGALPLCAGSGSR